MCMSVFFQFDFMEIIRETMSRKSSSSPALLPEGFVSYITREVLRAVKVLADHRIVHGNIAPENILLDLAYAPVPVPAQTDMMMTKDTDILSRSRDDGRSSPLHAGGGDGGLAANAGVLSVKLCDFHHCQFIGDDGMVSTGDEIHSGAVRSRVLSTSAPELWRPRSAYK